MKAQTALPQALYRTNLQLQARLAALLQDTARQWLDFWQRLVEEGVLESDAGLQALGRHDWQALAALPAEAFWRQLQQRFGDQQAATQVAVAAQTAFARGLQEALQAWQEDTVQALEAAGLALPLSGDWAALSGDWAALFAHWPPPPGRASQAAASASPATGPAPRRRPRKTAPAAKPAAKRTSPRPRRK